MSVLDEIVAYKAQEIAYINEKYGDNLGKLANQTTKPRDFMQAITENIAQNKMALISEIKKASPSKGIIRQDFNPINLAKIYENNGAACLSVLTEDKWFQGHTDYIAQIKQQAKIPILRKDFLITPSQVYYSRILGADCILLILAILDDKTALEMENIALNLGMSVLIEAHDAQEVMRANQMQSRLIGINNRNLATLKISLENGKAMLPLIKNGAIAIAESGMESQDDCLQMWQSGARGFLIGESLMNKPDVAEATHKLTHNWQQKIGK